MKFNDMKQHDANDWKSRLGMVYSTDPDFRYTTDEVEESETLPPDKQTLRVWLDRKQRAGRVVTLVRGFRGTAADLEALGRMLKQRCGVGGSVKEGEIIVQGDHRDRHLRDPAACGLRLQEGGKMTRIANQTTGPNRTGPAKIRAIRRIAPPATSGDGDSLRPHGADRSPARRIGTTT